MKHQNSYRVLTTFDNGYICNCCHRTQNEEVRVLDRAEALALVPRTMPVGKARWFFENSCLEDITVIEEPSGEEIASVRLSRPRGYGEEALGQAKLWSGWVQPEDEGPLVRIDICEGPADTWAECLAIFKARKDLANANPDTQ